MSKFSGKQSWFSHFNHHFYANMLVTAVGKRRYAFRSAEKWDMCAMLSSGVNKAHQFNIWFLEQKNWGHNRREMCSDQPVRTQHPAIHSECHSIIRVQCQKLQPHWRLISTDKQLCRVKKKKVTFFQKKIVAQSSNHKCQNNPEIRDL